MHGLEGHAVGGVAGGMVGNMLACRLLCATADDPRADLSLPGAGCLVGTVSAEGGILYPSEDHQRPPALLLLPPHGIWVSDRILPLLLGAGGGVAVLVQAAIVDLIRLRPGGERPEAGTVVGCAWWQVRWRLFMSA